MVSARHRLAIALLLAACGPLVADTGDDTSSTTRTDPDGGDDRPGTSAVTTTATTTNATSSTTSVDESSSAITDPSSVDSLDSVSFIDTLDGGQVTIECDVWAQDCPKGEKCMPWANDGGDEWNATRCSPIVDLPEAPGDPCFVEGSAWSGIDDCGARSVCWGVDPETNGGTCYAQCSGTEADPQCEDGRACWVGYEGTITMCVSICDPLAPMCATGETCVLIDGADWVARCIPMQLVAGLEYGAQCLEEVFPCAEGLVCAGKEHVPGCVGNCCTTLCDTSMPAECPDAASGQQCWPLFGAMPPPRFANVGACLDK